jgi:hypothetical protein
MDLPRLVFPEIMDQLPATDPGAMRIRKDLLFINKLIPHCRIIARTLAERLQKPPRVLVDIGCGGGSCMLDVARRLSPQWRDVTVVLLDQQNLISQETRAAFSELGWTAEPVVADVFEYFRDGRAPKADAIVSNLFLHHFELGQLGPLLARISEATSLMIACEPRRTKWTLRIGQTAWLIGVDDMTCHDTAASVWAGFRNLELSDLWPKDGAWQTNERRSFPFSHVFVAQRAG